ncbi:MAG: hypothetical protein CML56_04585 [Rhodobacteraceae bacterium]|nr:hypothetical protein [Paracoccaceae bacterium]
MVKVGCYVIVKEGVHDKDMPRGRRDGLVVGQVARDQWQILFSNAKALKFHESQLEVVSEPGR